MAAERPAQTSVAADENVRHRVGGIQHLLYQAGVKNPRSLCGLKLNPTPDAEFPTEDAPDCPRCAALNR